MYVEKKISIFNTKELENLKTVNNLMYFYKGGNNESISCSQSINMLVARSDLEYLNSSKNDRFTIEINNPYKIIEIQYEQAIKFINALEDRTYEEGCTVLELAIELAKRGVIR